MYSLFASWHSHFETHEIKNEKSFWRSFSSTFVEDFREAQSPLFSSAAIKKNNKKIVKYIKINCIRIKTS